MRPLIGARDRGIVQIELGARHVGLARRDFGLGLAQRWPRRSRAAPRRWPAPAQWPSRALGLLLGLSREPPSPCQRGLARLQLDLERRRDRSGRADRPPSRRCPARTGARSRCRTRADARRRCASARCGPAARASGQRLGLDRHDADVGRGRLGSIGRGGLIAGRQQQNQSEQPNRSRRRRSKTHCTPQRLRTRRHETARRVHAAAAVLKRFPIPLVVVETKFRQTSRRDVDEDPRRSRDNW